MTFKVKQLREPFSLVFYTFYYSVGQCNLENWQYMFCVEWKDMHLNTF